MLVCVIYPGPPGAHTDIQVGDSRAVTRILVWGWGKVGKFSN